MFATNSAVEKLYSTGQAETAKHKVQFYDRDAFPAEQIASFLCDGLKVGEGAVVVTTADHLNLVKECMVKNGMDATALEKAGLWFYLDANATMRALRKNGKSDDALLNAVLNVPIDHAKRLSPSGRLRIFGDMADLCIGSGDLATCLQLENRGKEFTADFQIFCAYSFQHFVGSSAIEFTDVCEAHNDILPAVPSPSVRELLEMLLRQSWEQRAELQSRSATAAFEAQRREAEYEQFRLYIDHWRGCIENELSVAKGAQSGSSKFQEDLDLLLAEALRLILRYCGEASEEMRSESAGSIGWHKCAGKILAYGQLTAALDKLQTFVRTRGGEESVSRIQNELSKYGALIH
jgi:hypothetical protein